MRVNTDCIIFTDLDGSLLDAVTYSYDAANAALRKVFESQTQLVLVSSKTRAEIEPLRARLHLPTPFIVENGGAVFIPDAYFPVSAEGSASCGPYRVIEIGAPYAGLRIALKEMNQNLSCRLQGFGDMTVEEIAGYTGLSPADARLAKQREYDEPFLVTGEDVPIQQLRAMAEAKGLQCTKGGRFYHLMGGNDKGQATVRLIELYRRSAQRRGHEILTIGIGDSLNDLPMLQVVDRPVLVRKPGGSYDSDIDLPNLIRAPGIGPVGWNTVVLDLLSCD
jgi:mannosyl-3-phosphoglycerate phosphatase